MGQSSDELRQEIDQHRQDAASKIDRLQGQVEGTAQDLRAQAMETANDVRDQVNTTVEDTIAAVKENVDIEQMVRERPLVSLGAALIGGFVLGGVLGGGGDDQRRSTSSYSSANGNATSSGGSSGGGGLGDTLRDMVKKSGLEETVSNATAALVGSVTDQVKQTIDRNVSGFSQKMDEAKQQPGSVMDKTRRTQP